MGAIIGTSFATEGFSFDPNLSPNNQAFSNPVLAVVLRQNPLKLSGLNVAGTTTLTALTVTGTGTFGALIASGTATFGALNVTGAGTFGALTASGTATFGSIKSFGVTAGALVDVTADSGTCNLVMTGLTVAQTATCVWSRQGNQVMLNIGSVSGSSTSTLMTLTGLPAVIQPIHSQNVYVPDMIDNGVATAAMLVLTGSSSTISVAKGLTIGNWTASGTKGFSNNPSVTVCYLLN